jgi:hypothetical protein
MLVSEEAKASEDDKTFVRGVLWRTRGPWLVLRDVTLINARKGHLPTDGEVIIHRANVSFIQVLP